MLRYTRYPADAATLRSIVKKGTHKSRKITRARALLAMSSGKDAAAVHAEVGISTTQYYRLKGRYLAGGAGRGAGRAPAQRATAEGDACLGSAHH